MALYLEIITDKKLILLLCEITWINLDVKINSPVDNQAKQSVNEQETSIENNNTDQGTNPDVNDEDDSVESIESIPFIAEPVKKKRFRGSE